ncbi:MAG: methionine biosynthesis protein MetW [Gammaproteobacteria bacterium]|nr:methionine biosynthesis protein MetW [Gammaproteobacteria bacterium]HJL95796.1 methionine biosynthesis protein MetW [SAR86 cluster bacterium]|tara:strand:- start:7128 stop:7715 length:588 start_codon:yes stop_codon:yes gene_type:complete
MNTLDIINNWVKKDSKVLDLGCGGGEILVELGSAKNIKAMGVEIDSEKINICIANGINVIEQNIDEGLHNFSDHSFDVVIMSQTIQVLKDPKKALEEITRIGSDCIVTIPNFGHWKTRLYLLLTGRMPVTSSLPDNWHDTPNIHLCTLKDFELLCLESTISINGKIGFNSSGNSNIFTRIFPNLLCASAIYKISK